MAKKKTSKYYFKNEKELMRSLGLNPTPGSGNRIIKEDGQNEKIIAQLKSTEADSITIKLNDLTTLLYNATVSHKVPIFINQFVNGPVLISCRLEDFSTVSEYLQTGKINRRFDDFTNEEETKSTKDKIKSSKRSKVKNIIIKEREKRSKEYEEERRKRK